MTSSGSEGPTRAPGVGAGPDGSRSPVLAGLLLCAVLAAVAVTVQRFAEARGITAVSGVFVAIVLGATWRATLGLSSSVAPGSKFAAKTVLKIAIVLLGLRFSLTAVAETGLTALVAIVGVIAAAFASIAVLRRLMPLPGLLAVLISVGTAICGNSAIAAAAPILGADEEEVAFASGTITLFGTIAVVVFPLIGVALGFGDAQFGIAAGAGVHDSAQAVASGFIFSERAGEIATVVKLTRTAFLVPLLIVLSLTSVDAARPVSVRGVAAVMPWFTVGFVVLSAVRTAGDAIVGDTALWEAVLGATAWAATFMLVVAMVGIGLGTSWSRMRTIGIRPFWAGLVAAMTVAGVAFTLAILTGGTSA